MTWFLLVLCTGPLSYSCAQFVPTPYYSQESCEAAGKAVADKKNSAGNKVYSYICVPGGSGGSPPSKLPG